MLAPPARDQGDTRDEGARKRTRRASVGTTGPSPTLHPAYRLLFIQPIACSSSSPSPAVHPAHRLLFVAPIACSSSSPSPALRLAHRLLFIRPIACSSSGPSPALHPAHRLPFIRPISCPLSGPSPALHPAHLLPFIRHWPATEETQGTRERGNARAWRVLAPPAHRLLFNWLIAYPSSGSSPALRPAHRLLFIRPIACSSHFQSPALHPAHRLPFIRLIAYPSSGPSPALHPARGAAGLGVDKDASRPGAGRASAWTRMKEGPGGAGIAHRKFRTRRVARGGGGPRIPQVAAALRVLHWHLPFLCCRSPFAHSSSRIPSPEPRPFACSTKRQGARHGRRGANPDKAPFRPRPLTSPFPPGPTHPPRPAAPRPAHLPRPTPFVYVPYKMTGQDVGGAPNKSPFPLPTHPALFPHPALFLHPARFPQSPTPPYSPQSPRLALSPPSSHRGPALMPAR